MPAWSEHPGGRNAGIAEWSAEASAQSVLPTRDDMHKPHYEYKMVTVCIDRQGKSVFRPHPFRFDNPYFLVRCVTPNCNVCPRSYPDHASKESARPHEDDNQRDRMVAQRALERISEDAKTSKVDKLLGSLFGSLKVR
jgi:hypothetical protein